MNMRIASLVAVCATVMCAWGAESVGIVGLQVNHLAEPRHVGAKPSFGWRMETARAGARQVAYRVKVAHAARNARDRSMPARQTFGSLAKLAASSSSEGM